MTEPMRADRVVLDSNVLISAVISPLGKPFACLAWVHDHATLIASRDLIDEVETRLARPKFAKCVDEARRRAVCRHTVASQISRSSVDR